MGLFENNLSPYLTAVEGTTPASPAAGQQRLFVRSSDHVLCMVNSSGTVVPLPSVTLGGANTVLHGGASVPAYSAVLPADLDVSADNTTADATTGHHGLLPKLGGGTTNFLRADGSWNAPAGGGGGALVLLEQHTASTSATLDFTTAISATYDTYEIHFVAIMPATDANPRFLCSTDGGSTWDSTSGHYDWLENGTPSGISGGSDSDTALKMVDYNMNATGQRNALAGVGHLYLSSAGYATFVFEINAGITGQNKPIMITTTGHYLSATSPNALRFMLSSGNIASGTIRVYGIAKV